MINSPYELLDMADQEQKEFRVESFEKGTMRIESGQRGYTKEIPVLRVRVPMMDKLQFPFYWDITSKTLIAQLEPFLAAGQPGKSIYRIKKFGVAPAARFSLEVIPVG